jgi:hypothetical protein
MAYGPSELRYEDEQASHQSARACHRRCAGEPPHWREGWLSPLHRSGKWKGVLAGGGGTTTSLVSSGNFSSFFYCRMTYTNSKSQIHLKFLTDVYDLANESEACHVGQFDKAKDLPA